MIEVMREVSSEVRYEGKDLTFTKTGSESNPLNNMRLFDVNFIRLFLFINFSV